MTPSPRSETMCQNGNVVFQENQGQTKSFRDVVTWFGLPDYPEGDARNANGPGVNAAKRIWSSYSKQKADPANDSPYGQSYIDIMIEVIQKVETRFEDPSFKPQSVSGYCKRLLKDKAKQMKFGALGGGWYHTGLLDKDENKIMWTALGDEDAPAKKGKFSDGDPEPDFTSALTDSEWIHRFRRALNVNADSPRTLQSALTFVAIALDYENFDSADVPFTTRGTTSNRFLMKCAVYLSTPINQQAALITGEAATVSRRFKGPIEDLESLLQLAYTAACEEE